MDMELNMLIGGPGGPDGLPDPMHGVKDSPVYRTLRGAVNCATTLMAGFTTVRNLGLMVYTAGFLLDVDLMKAVDQGWFPGPRIFPAGHAITPTGGHLDPTMFQGWRPGSCPRASSRGSPTACPRCARRCATRSSMAPSSSRSPPPVA